MAERPDSASKAGIPLEVMRANYHGLRRAMTLPSQKKPKEQKGLGYRRDVCYTVIRGILGGLGTEQVQMVTLTTDKMYNQVAKVKGVPPRSVELPEGAQGHWIGSPQAAYVMMFSHGGGFYGGATVGHMRYMFNLQREMEKRGLDFSIFVLTYTLSPKGLYPLQLRQAASALDYLLTAQQRDPGTILLGGDSAGGGLTAALLQHTVRPHPQVSPVINLSHPLRAVLLISPWISCDMSLPSMAANGATDYISPRALKRAGLAYIPPGSQHDAYSEPSLSPPEWWVDIAKGTVRNMMIWGGSGEVLIDSIRLFADKVGAGFASAEQESRVGGAADEKEMLPRFVFTVTPGCGHEQMIIDELMFGMVKGVAAKEVENWLSAMLT